jgi:hypothetical protein
LFPTIAFPQVKRATSSGVSWTLLPRPGSCPWE